MSNRKLRKPVLNAYGKVAAHLTVSSKVPLMVLVSSELAQDLPNDPDVEGCPWFEAADVTSVVVVSVDQSSASGLAQKAINEAIQAFKPVRGSRRVASGKSGSNKCSCCTDSLPCLRSVQWDDGSEFVFSYSDTEEEELRLCGQVTDYRGPANGADARPEQ